MNQQYLEYVRGAVSLALADYSGQTKGQLAAFEGSALACTTRFKRQRLRTVVVGNRKVCQATDPMLCTETRTRKQPFPPIDPLTFSTSSWRRAISTLEAHQLAWVRYCYAHDLDFNGQVTICKHIWGEFEEGKKITAKVRKRLESLAWLAVQQVAGGCGCLLGGSYSHTELASLSGISKSTWSETYAPHWERMIFLVARLDRLSIEGVARKRVDARFKHLAS